MFDVVRMAGQMKRKQRTMHWNMHALKLLLRRLSARIIWRIWHVHIGYCTLSHIFGVMPCIWDLYPAQCEDPSCTAQVIVFEQRPGAGDSWAPVFNSLPKLAQYWYTAWNDTPVSRSALTCFYTAEPIVVTTYLQREWDLFKTLWNNVKIYLCQTWMTSHMQSFMLHVELQNFLNVAASPMKNPQSSARKI